MTSSRLTVAARSLRVCLALLAASTAACGGEDAPTTLVSGRVFSAYSLAPLAGARVATPAGEATTDARGKFEVRAPVGGSAAMALESSGHAAGVAALALRAGQPAYVEVRLVPFGAAASMQASSGGTVTIGDASVLVPADAFTKPGADVSGQVDVSVAVLDPRKAPQLRAAPSALVAERDDGSAAALAATSMMDITAMQGDERLGLKPGSSLSVDFPAFGGAAPSKPLYSLDPASGKWRAEGMAMRMDLGGGKVVYRATLTHLSWWAVADELEMTCVTACATRDGAPAADVGVMMEGVGVGQLVSATTDVDGCFSADVGVGESFRLRFVGADAFAESTFATAASSGGACADLGTIELLVSTQVDGVPVGGGLCGAQVIDPQIDRTACGGCGNVCLSGQDCVAGACVAIVCAEPLVLCGNECISGTCALCVADSECGTDHCIDPDFDGLGTCAPAVSSDAALFRAAASATATAQCGCFAEYGFASEAECLASNIDQGLSPTLTTEMIDYCISYLGEVEYTVDWQAALECGSRALAEYASCLELRASCVGAAATCEALVIPRLDLCAPYLDDTLDELLGCLALPIGEMCTTDEECQTGYCEPGMQMCTTPTPVDTDLDGWAWDNCPDVPNDQRDADYDGVGDACDPDPDDDGFLAGSDNCPLVAQIDQADFDVDGVGDLCDFDDQDGDLVLDWQDNCPTMPNPLQGNIDGDLLGDPCDPDDDQDSIDDVIDNCPTVDNPGQEDSMTPGGPGDACDSGLADSDLDGVDDDNDVCDVDYDPDQSDLDGDTIGDVCDTDVDGDGVENVADNCPWSHLATADQTDQDEDGVGDLCDWDVDGDGLHFSVDNCPAVENLDQADADWDGYGDLCDL